MYPWIYERLIVHWCGSEVTRLEADWRGRKESCDVCEQHLLLLFKRRFNEKKSSLDHSIFYYRCAKPTSRSELCNSCDHILATTLIAQSGFYMLWVSFSSLRKYIYIHSIGTIASNWFWSRTSSRAGQYSPPQSAWRRA